MGLKRNIAANYAGSAVVYLLPLLVLPFYLKRLGPDVFGLVGFTAMVQALLLLVDAGVGQALIREFALRFGQGSAGRRHAAELLCGFELFYGLAALGGGALLLTLSGPIARHWLQLGPLPVEAGRLAVIGAGAIFAAQFPGSVYRSLLAGAQAQVRLNVNLAANALLRHGGGALAVWLYPDLRVYLAWQFFSALTETAVRRFSAWRLLGIRRGEVDWSFSDLRPVLHFSAGMSGAVLLGALTVQLDRIILSRMVPVAQFGYYTMASSLALGVLQTVYPLFQAFTPRIVLACAEQRPLRRLNLRLLALAGGIAGAVLLGFAGLGRLFLRLWLHGAEPAEAVHPLLLTLLFGVFFNALYNVGYVNWVARRKTRRILVLNGLGLGLSLLLMPWLIARQGTAGAALAWTVVHLTLAALSFDWLRRDPSTPHMNGGG